MGMTAVPAWRGMTMAARAKEVAAGAGAVVLMRKRFHNLGECKPDGFTRMQPDR
jgi:hypothetical protein